MTHGTVCCILLDTCKPLSGTKNVARELKKVTEGRVRDRNITWFPELSDKNSLINVSEDDVEVRIRH